MYEENSMLRTATTSFLCKKNLGLPMQMFSRNILIFLYVQLVWSMIVLQNSCIVVSKVNVLLLSTTFTVLTKSIIMLIV